MALAPHVGPTGAVTPRWLSVVGLLSYLGILAGVVLIIIAVI